jgi:hypothetical protein
MIGIVSLIFYSSRTLYEADLGYYPYESLFVALSRLFYGVTTVGGTLFAIRWYRAAVVVDADGVTLRNVRRTYRLRWEEIAQPQPSSDLPGVSLRLVDGSIVSSSLFGADNLLYRQQDADFVKRAIDEIRPS